MLGSNRPDPQSLGNGGWLFNGGTAFLTDYLLREVPLNVDVALDVSSIHVCANRKQTPNEEIIHEYAVHIRISMGGYTIRSTRSENCGSRDAVQMREMNEWGAKYAVSVRW